MHLHLKTTSELYRCIVKVCVHCESPQLHRTHLFYTIANDRSDNRFTRNIALTITTTYEIFTENYMLSISGCSKPDGYNIRGGIE